MYNCELGLRRAHQDGDVHWLLHIDSDELFYIDTLDVRPHFTKLHHVGCQQYLYPIHEGIPEAFESTNVFADVTLFRRHYSTLPSAAHSADARSQLATAVRFWRARRPFSIHSYFLGSEQGKSATRVLPGVVPMSVHAFYPPTAADVPQCWSAFPEPCSPALRVVSAQGSPCILHYISCSYSFWRSKYKLLGSFADTKPGGAAAGGDSIKGTFHADSRDVLSADDELAAKEMYAREVCLLNSDEARLQTSAGVCMRLCAVQQALSHMLSS